ncbi:MAG: ABC transporter ATP-binding protein [Treponemataceae bacterium]|nr:ABC transporter ATP-binding protein [Treponemataceae bacterium]
MTREILSVRNLEKTYETGGERLTVFKGLSFSVEEGSKTVILGKSGSGKSTLLNIIGSIDTATAGTVQAGPWNVTALAEREQAAYRSKFLGLIFQFHYLLKDFTALENVWLPAYMGGTSKKEAVARARALLSDVGLSDREAHLPSELSGGERQRVAVARALVNDPSLILADEPTGNLDPATAAVIGELLFSMADRYRKTLVLVTHDLGLAEKGGARYTLGASGLEPADLGGGAR